MDVSLVLCKTKNADSAQEFAAHVQASTEKTVKLTKNGRKCKCLFYAKKSYYGISNLTDIKIVI